MSMMRCDRHGPWDSDNYEACPRCELQQSGQSQEFWWLIETQWAFVGTGHPGYATGRIVNSSHDWTLDPHQAMRFATQEAAETIRVQLGLWDGGFGGFSDSVAVEHGFISAAPPPDALLAAELRGMEKAAEICDDNGLVYGIALARRLRAEAERLRGRDDIPESKRGW